MKLGIDRGTSRHDGVARLALVAVCSAEIARLRDEYGPLQARVMAGGLDDELCDRHCDVAMRLHDAVERLQDARNGLAGAWSPGDIGTLDLIPIRPEA